MAVKIALAKQLGVNPEDINLGGRRRLQEAWESNVSYSSYSDIPCVEIAKIVEPHIRHVDPGYKKELLKRLSKGCGDKPQVRSPSRRLQGVAIKIGMTVPKD